MRLPSSLESADRNSHSIHPDCRGFGFTLIECLVYISVLFVVVGLTFATFYSLLSHHRDIARCSEDILRALKASEIWREDIRAATRPPILENDQHEQALHIRKHGDSVTYLFSNGQVWRIVNDQPPQDALLTHIKFSTMRMDARTYVQVWRWDLELVAARKKAQLKPLFTFTAVIPDRVKVPPATPTTKTDLPPPAVLPASEL
jgi:type II secretory pathway component PulJ